MNNSFERSINGTVKPILDACCGGGRCSTSIKMMNGYYFKI